MSKSLGYDSKTSTILIARNEIGDFGLHLSLIRSFSKGNNFPPESPFFPGKPLPYHYYFDLASGMLERAGFRIDIAFNLLSILSFSFLLFLIYKLPQIIFKRSVLIGSLSVLLFVFHSSLTFIDFLKVQRDFLSLFHNLWYLPNYIHSGPFDGSLISTFFTLNVFLNQRHLIAALVISLGIFYFMIQRLFASKKISYSSLIIIGIVIGLSSRIHTLIFISTLISMLFLFILFKRIRSIPFLCMPALMFFSLHLKDILNQSLTHPFFNPGFLAAKPLSVYNVIHYWFLNLGVSIILIPLGFFLATRKQKLLLLGFLPLFVLGNIFQFGFRIEHNHSLFNFFIIFTNFYVAFLLVRIYREHLFGKILFSALCFLLMFSGVLDLIAVKNDYHYPLVDIPANKFMQWIKMHTKPGDIFLSKEEILDPITLSGRKNYLGHRYYLEVMGYDYREKLSLVKKYFESNSSEMLASMKKENIKYVAIPLKPIVDFNYKVNVSFFNENLPKVYQDKELAVYKL